MISEGSLYWENTLPNANGDYYDFGTSRKANITLSNNYSSDATFQYRDQYGQRTEIDIPAGTGKVILKATVRRVSVLSGTLDVIASWPEEYEPNVSADPTQTNVEVINPPATPVITDFGVDNPEPIAKDATLRTITKYFNTNIRVTAGTSIL